MNLKLLKNQKPNTTKALARGTNASALTGTPIGSLLYPYLLIFGYPVFSCTFSGGENFYLYSVYFVPLILATLKIFSILGTDSQAWKLRPA